MNQSTNTRPPKEEIPEVMHVHTVAKHLKCHRSYVYKLIEEEEIAAVRLGKRGIRVIKASVTDYLARNRVNPADRLGLEE